MSLYKSWDNKNPSLSVMWTVRWPIYENNNAHLDSKHRFKLSSTTKTELARQPSLVLPVEFLQFL